MFNYGGTPSPSPSPAPPSPPLGSGVFHPHSHSHHHAHQQHHHAGPSASSTAAFGAGPSTPGGGASQSAFANGHLSSIGVSNRWQPSSALISKLAGGGTGGGGGGGATGGNSSIGSTGNTAGHGHSSSFSFGGPHSHHHGFSNGHNSLFSPGGIGGPPGSGAAAPPPHHHGHHAHHGHHGNHLGGIGPPAQGGMGMGGMLGGGGMMSGGMGGFSGGAGGGSGQSTGMVGGGPITPQWAKQLENASISRSSGTAHHHARAAQLQARGQGSAALTITDPNRPVKPLLTSGGGAVGANGAYVNGGGKGAREEEAGGFRSGSVLSMRSGTTSMSISTGTGVRGGDGGPSSPTETTFSSEGDGGPASAGGRRARARRSSGDLHRPREPAVQTWTTVDMGGLRLKSLSKAVFDYTFLTTLFLCHNSLTSLPAAIQRLSSLTVLDVSNNKLTALPPELGMITTLQQLYAFDNHLTTLPPEMGTLHQLEDLGIEGNPLSDSLLGIIQKEGTGSLIAFLRDSCPVPLPPAERDWISVDTDFVLPTLPTSSNSNPPPPPETFTALSYNVLCERYATERIYGYTPSWALAWDYRKDLILQEVLQYGPDIACLQEVDVEQYEDFFSPNLNEQGYEGLFFPKTRARTMSSEERRHVDGCATFYKTATFQLIEQDVIEFNQIPLRTASMKTEDMFNRVMTKDNICVVALLEHRRSGARQIVANVHIHWDPEFRDVKLVQVGMMMDQIEKIADRFARLPKRLNLGEGYTEAPAYADGSKIPTIICGDFNSVPESGPCQFLALGSVAKDHEDFMGHAYGPYTSGGMKHRLALKGAYSHIGELPFTNYTPGYRGVIDHIWYTTNSLGVTGLLGRIDETYLEKVVGFPNAHFASDHVPVLAELKVKPVS